MTKSDPKKADLDEAITLVELRLCPVDSCQGGDHLREFLKLGDRGGSVLPKKKRTGWWLTYPSEKYEFVSWDDYPIYEMENKQCLKPPTSEKNGRLTNRNAVLTNQKHGEFNLPMVGLPMGWWLQRNMGGSLCLRNKMRIKAATIWWLVWW